MGLWRRALACAGLAVACCLAEPALPAQGACKLALYASVDVRMDESGAVLVPVQLDGRDAWMYLALAQGLPVIFSNVANDLGLLGEAAAELRLQAGGQVDRRVRVPHMKVGAADFTGWEFLVHPVDGDAYGTYAGLPVAGTITSQFLREVDVELNLAERKMNLFTHTACRGGALYWGGGYTALPMYNDDSGLIVFATELDGKRIETSFDTTSRGSRLSSGAATRFYGFEAGNRTMGLAAKGLLVSNAKVELDSSASSCALTAQAGRSDAIGYESCTNAVPFSIGTDLLSRLRIYLAPKEEMIYISRVKPKRFPAS